jgi:hypothetical protein
LKLEGDFVWHNHQNTDETFIVLEGLLRIDFRDGAVHVAAGEMFVVPKGVEHKPYAEHEVKLLLIEPRGVLNTGQEGGERTAENDVWICRQPRSVHGHKCETHRTDGVSLSSSIGPAEAGPVGAAHPTCSAVLAGDDERGAAALPLRSQRGFGDRVRSSQSYRAGA